MVFTTGLCLVFEENKAKIIVAVLVLFHVIEQRKKLNKMKKLMLCILFINFVKLLKYGTAL